MSATTLESEARHLVVLSASMAGRERRILLHRVDLPETVLHVSDSLKGKDDRFTNACIETAQRVLFDQCVYDDGSDAAHALLVGIEAGRIVSYGADDTEPVTHVVHVTLDAESAADLSLLEDTTWQPEARAIRLASHGRYIAHTLDLSKDWASFYDTVRCMMNAALAVAVSLLLLLQCPLGSLDDQEPMSNFVREINRAL